MVPPPSAPPPVIVASHVPLLHVPPRLHAVDPQHGCPISPHGPGVMPPPVVPPSIIPPPPGSDD